ncbi:hypothetical protein O3P69_003806 [Scylla paramamosain]|uniref:Uncharacterized protein n=1 Tax=Scylla paramamosain TaxID=85552 RepID=A0AAW0UEN7_SCYPA
MLFEVFMQCKDWNCVTSNGAYFRERVNEKEEFIYAVYHAIKHSPLTQHVVLPAMYEVKPHHFTKIQVIEKAYEAKEMKLRNVYFQNNFTGTPNDIEQRVAYFREDIGVGTHHLMIHLENPFCHLPPLQKLKLDEPLKEGFNPQTTYKFGAPFPTRNDHIHLHDVDKVGRIHEIIHMEDRIHDAIAHSSMYNPNRKYYGNLTTLAYTMLDHQTDLKNKYDTLPGVLAHLEILLCYHAAWTLHKRIDNIFREHMDSLPPYTKQQLEFPGITVINLETYFEEYKYDLIKAFIDITTQTEFYDIYASMPRFNHKKFSCKINV